LKEFGPLAIALAICVFLRRNTVSRLLFLIPAGLLTGYMCGTGPLAYAVPWIAIPFIFAACHYGGADDNTDNR
jgi:hypothetical protein